MLRIIHKGSILLWEVRKKTFTKVTVFFQQCVPQAERDVHFVCDVSFGSDERFARDKEHITSL